MSVTYTIICIIQSANINGQISNTTEYRLQCVRCQRAHTYKPIRNTNTRSFSFHRLLTLRRNLYGDSHQIRDMINCTCLSVDYIYIFVHVRISFILTDQIFHCDSVHRHRTERRQAKNIIFNWLAVPLRFWSIFLSLGCVS